MSRRLDGGDQRAEVPAPPAPERVRAETVNLAAALASFDEAFQPRIVGQYNDSKIMVAKTRGEFVWHSHPDTDDFFLVLDGRLTIQLRDGDVELGPGEMYVVPRGVEHCPRSARKRNPLARIPLARKLLGAESEAHILLIEPMGTPNTGDSTEREAAPEREL